MTPSPDKAIENQSIIRRLTASLMITVLIVSVIAVTAMYLFVSQAAIRDLNQKADETLAYLVATLEMPLWGIDNDGVQTIGRAVSHDESIVRLIIRNEFGEVIYSMEKEKSNDLINRSGKIFHKQGDAENLAGDVSVSLTPAIYEESIRWLLFFSILIIFLILISVVVVTVIFIRTSLNKPLNVLNVIAKRFACGTYDTSGHILPYLEFQPFGRALVQLAEKVERQIRMIQGAEEKYRSIFENATEGIFQSTAEGRYLSVNPAFARMQGYDSSEELIADIAHQHYVNSEDQARFRNALEEHGSVEGFETEWYRRDGTRIRVSINAHTVCDQDGGTRYYEGGVENITERKRAEESLRESRQRFRELAELLPETVFEMDINGDLTFVNLNALDMFGYSQEDLDRGLNGFEMISPEERPRALESAKKIMDGEKIGINEYKALRKDGSTFPAIMHSAAKIRDGKPVGIRGIVIDITETKRLEAQLLQSQKLEAIGNLAGGIAHDFNNILAPILGYAEMALSDIPEFNPKRHGLEQIRNAAIRARDLVKQILAFGRSGEEQQHIPVEISSIVKEALKLLRASLPSSIEIKQEIDSGVVLADATQIHQVLMNLGTNAAHAMDDKGILEVRLSRVNLSENDLVGPSTIDLKPGPHLMLRVSDTGTGMDARTIERIFDPYFTTKEVGKGCGLGLAVVHGIVKRHEGAITVQSEPGKGTTFSIYIPAMEASTALVVETREALPTGTERILLIDDERIVVEMGTEILEQLGYKVTPETDSLRALEIFSSRPGEFDLIITDYTMPKLTGIDLSIEIRHIRPEIPIILCTGFSEKVTMGGTIDLGVELVMKPFSMKQIAESIRKVLRAQEP